MLFLHTNRSIQFNSIDFQLNPNRTTPQCNRGAFNQSTKTFPPQWNTAQQLLRSSKKYRTRRAHRFALLMLCFAVNRIKRKQFRRLGRRATDLNPPISSIQIFFHESPSTEGFSFWNKPWLKRAQILGLGSLFVALALFLIRPKYESARRWQINSNRREMRCINSCVVVTGKPLSLDCVTVFVPLRRS